MITFSHFSFSDLVNCLHHKNEADDSVFYLRTPDFKKMLYLNSAFEKVWGISNQTMIDNPEVLVPSFIKHEKFNMEEQGFRATSRFFVNSPAKVIIFPIKNTQGKLIYIEDSLSLIFDENGKFKAFAGIATPIESNQLETRMNALEAKSKEFSDFENTLQFHLDCNKLSKTYDGFLSLKDKVGDYLPPIPNARPKYHFRDVTLSYREMQIASYLTKNLNSRQIATKLNLSFRTCENYIQRLFDKLSFTTKYEMILAFKQTPTIIYFTEE